MESQRTGREMIRQLGSRSERWRYECVVRALKLTKGLYREPVGLYRAPIGENLRFEV